MTSSNEASRRRGSCAFWLVLSISGFVALMIAGITLAMLPGLGVRYAPAPNTPVSILWAAANIAKPTYTPSPEPTITPTALPTVEAPLPDAETPNLEMSIQNPVVGPSSSVGKSILVSISEQHLTAYENGQLVYSFVASTGIRNSTAVGEFSVLDKIPNAYGSTWNIWMPNWLGIYYSGGLENGIHALPILPNGNELWSGFLGTPVSFGCVVLGSRESLELYNWADIGTAVEIVW